MLNCRFFNNLSVFKPTITSKMHHLGSLGYALATSAMLVCGAPSLAVADADDKLVVATSIVPIERLVRQIGGDAISSQLILPATQSVHHAAFRPSQVKMIENSDIIFAVHPYLENLLGKVIAENPEKWVLLADALEENLLIREHAEADHDDHDGHDGHDGHDDHKGHDEHDDHKGHDGHDDHKGHDGHDDHKGHDEHDDHKGHDGHDDHKGHDEHDEHKGHGHVPGQADYHLFFSPVMMGKMVAVITDELVALRPEHEALFRANAKATIAELEVAKARIAKQVRHTAPNHFIAMHDLTLYLEADFAIEATGFLLTHDHGKPSAAHLRALQNKAIQDKTKCMFYEPQLSKRLVSQLASDMALPVVELDHLGASLEDSATIGDYWANIGAAFDMCFHK